MARLHTLRSESGFNLIELMVVLAISSILVAIAIIGQRTLRSRAQFDAAVEQVVSTISNAQNQAVAGVNVLGTGDGTLQCPTGPPPSLTNQVVFAGTAWTADGTGPDAVFKIDYYKTIPGFPPASSCVFDSITVGLPTSVQLSPVGNVKGILFVRTDTGSLNICPVTAASSAAFVVAAQPFYAQGSCVNGATALTLVDADGHTALIQVDASGLARRMN